MIKYCPFAPDWDFNQIFWNMSAAQEMAPSLRNQLILLFQFLHGIIGAYCLHVLADPSPPLSKIHPCAIHCHNFKLIMQIKNKF